MTVGGKQITAQIVGEVYAPSPRLGDLLTSRQTLASAAASLPVRRYDGRTEARHRPAAYQARAGPGAGAGLHVTVIGTASPPGQPSTAWDCPR